MDNISQEKRSYIMSRIRSKDTKPEVMLRKALFKKGLRYRKHYELPGKPDIAFVSKKIAIFINGCFWHGHGCKIDNKPETNKEFWRKKINKNKERDKDNYKRLQELGWNYHIVWECSIHKNLEKEVQTIINILKKIK